jgi:hypothetical protein
MLLLQPTRRQARNPTLAWNCSSSLEMIGVKLFRNSFCISIVSRHNDKTISNATWQAKRSLIVTKCSISAFAGTDLYLRGGDEQRGAGGRSLPEGNAAGRKIGTGEGAGRCVGGHREARIRRAEQGGAPPRRG